MNFLKNFFGHHNNSDELSSHSEVSETQKIGPLFEAPSAALIQILEQAARRRSEIQAIILANILVDQEGPQLVAGIRFVTGTELALMEHTVGALWEFVTHASEELSSLVYLKLNNPEILRLFELNGIQVYGAETL